MIEDEPCPHCGSSEHNCGPNGEDCDISRTDWMEMNTDLAAIAESMWGAEDKEKGLKYNPHRSISDRN